MHFLRGAILIDGIILGAFTWLSLILTYNHLPKLLKELLIKNTLVADLIATGLAFGLLSGISQSITSVIGSITTGLLINLTLIIFKNKQET